MKRVIFEKPDIAGLRKRFTLFDMHFHTRYTDGRNRVETIVRRARALGIGLAITDHNDIRGALELARHQDVPSIPGIEVTSCEGTHVLAYFEDLGALMAFYQRHILPSLGSSLMSSTSLSMEEILYAAKSLGAVTVFPHPCFPAYVGVCNPCFEPSRLARLLAAVDGIEAINAENLHRWNQKAAALGRDLKKPLTGGSDGHFLSSLGRVLTVAQCEPTAKAMLDAIRQQQTIVIGKETNLFRKVAAGGAKMRSGVLRSPELLEKNIRFSYQVLHRKTRAIRDRVIVGVRSIREDGAGRPW